MLNSDISKKCYELYNNLENNEKISYNEFYITKYHEREYVYNELLNRCNSLYFAYSKDIGAVKKCSELCKNDSVVFMYYSDIYKRKCPIDGSVIYVDKELNKVAICYLFGYKSHTESIQYEEILGVNDKFAPVIYFDHLYGRTTITIPE